MPWEEHLQLHLLPKAPAARGVQEEAGSPEGTNLGRRADTSLPSCSNHTCSKGSPNHPCAALFPQLCPATHQGSLQKGNHTMDGKTQVKFMVYSGHSVSQRKQATSFETVILCKMALRSCTSLLLPSSSLILHTICAHWSLQALLYYLYCINSCRENCFAVNSAASSVRLGQYHSTNNNSPTCWPQKWWGSEVCVQQRKSPFGNTEPSRSHLYTDL